MPNDDSSDHTRDQIKKPTPWEKVSDTIRFISRIPTKGRSIGALAPSSRHLAEAMIEEVGFSPDRLLVEFGPGTGSVTRAIAKRLPKGMMYLGIDRDEHFVHLLRRRFPKLTFSVADAAELPQISMKLALPRPNDVVSSLPFASLPKVVTERIIHTVRASLLPGGTFTTFQYIASHHLPTARNFRAMVDEMFGPHIQRTVVWRNIPPANVLHWQVTEELSD